MANGILEKDICINRVINGIKESYYPITRDSNVMVENDTNTLDEKLKDIDNNINNLKNTATTSTNGLLSYSDKLKLDNISENASKTEESDLNGYVKINGEDVKVYELPPDWVGSGSADSVTINFTEASSRSNILSKENLSTLFGKISKIFSDLKSLAFSDKISVDNLDNSLTEEYNKRITTDNVTDSLEITESGWIADARAIARLKNQIDTVSNNLSNLDVALTSENCIGVIDRSGFSISIPDSILNSKIEYLFGTMRITWASSGKCSEVTFSIPKSGSNEYFHTIYSDQSSGGFFSSSYTYHISISISENNLIFKVYNNSNSLISTFSSLCTKNPEVDLYDISLVRN